MVKVLMPVLKFTKQHKIYFLKDLSQRVDSVKEENLKLRAENQVLGQYIENLMAASSVFQSTSPRVKKK
jgi:short coiled-coil protein